MESNKILPAYIGSSSPLQKTRQDEKANYAKHGYMLING